MYIGELLLFQAKTTTTYWCHRNELFWRLVSFSGSEVTIIMIQGNMFSVKNLKVTYVHKVEVAPIVLIISTAILSIAS